MVKAKEVDYPRGRIPQEGGTSTTKKKIVHDTFLGDLFQTEKSTPISKEGKSKKKKSKNSLTTDENELLAGKGGFGVDKFEGEALTYENICDGLLSLGRVSEAQNGKLVVNLPCRVVGEVSVLNVSGPYTKLVNKLASEDSLADDEWHTLPEMYTVGQLVSVAVTQVADISNGNKKVILSTDPKELHRNYAGGNIVQGMILAAAVESVEDHGYIMDVGIAGTRAFLPTEHAVKFIKSVNRGKKPGVGQVISCQVASVKQANNMFNLQLTADPKSVHKFKYTDDMDLNYNLLLPGMLVDTVVMEAHKGGLKVHVMDLEGYIHKDHLKDIWTSPTKTHEVSSTISPRILYLFPNGSNPYLSLQPSLYPHNVMAKSDKEILGTNQRVKIVRVFKSGIIVRIGDTNLKGIVSLRRCSDDATCNIEQIKKQFPGGSSHECKILDYNNMDSIFIGSFKKSMLEQKVIRLEQMQPGTTVKVTVQFWKPNGAVVTFGLLRGLVPNLHFGNIPIRNPSAKFPPGSSFKAKVMRVNRDKRHIELTAKKDLVRTKIPVVDSLENTAVGLISKGVVLTTNKGGVVIETIGGLRCFAPLKYLGVDRGSDLRTLFFAGRILSFQVVQVEPEKNNLIVSLLIKEEEDAEEDSDDEVTVSSEANGNSKKRKQESAEGKEEPKSKKNKKGAKVAEEPMEVEIKEEVTEDASLVDEDGNLKLPTSSFWDLQGSDDEAEAKADVPDAEEGSSEKANKKLSKKERKKLREQQLRDAETALADSTGNVKSEDDYERLILASPNSSLCYIQFMAHYLQQGEIAKAKEVGKRALKMILYREEQERFNVWVALLNLENTHGTPETLNAVLGEALHNNDDFKILSTMAEIHCQSKHFQEAEEIFKKMMKKFKDKPEPCVKYGKFLYLQQRFDDARELFKKALVHLDKANHVQLISKYSQLEMELGERDRGRTLFDQLLGTYPKRIDLWLVYANALAKLEDFQGAKNVLIQAIELRHPPKKSKPLFTRLFEIDKQSPNPDPDAIRQLAVDYTAGIASGKS